MKLLMEEQEERAQNIAKFGTLGAALKVRTGPKPVPRSVRS
jgi:hypothetical protein